VPLAGAKAGDRVDPTDPTLRPPPALSSAA